MTGHMNLVGRKKQTKIIFVIQVIVFIGLLIVFWLYMPWLNSKPISEYPYQKYQAPPVQAKYFVINHGKPYYFVDSSEESPIKFWLVISGFVIGYFYLIVSIFLMYRLNNEKFPWKKKFVFYERKQPNKSLKSGAPKSGAP